MSQRERSRYVLTDYAVELRSGGWYFGHPLGGPTSFRGPYRSIASVTMMIARQLQREITRRHRPVAAPQSVDRTLVPPPSSG